jgi:pyruvate kinase
MNTQTESTRRTKIVCTLGPATSSEAAIRDLMVAGANVMRLNFSHGTHEDHLQAIRRVRAVAEELHRPVAILQDLQGPKIRLGELPEERCLEAGAEIALASTTGPVPGDALPVEYPWLAEDVEVGDRILLADGLVELEATAIDGAAVRCLVVVGGEVSSRKGVNLPRSELRVPSFTDKDRADLEFGLEHGVDLVAMSFVRRETDIDPVAEILAQCRRPRPLLVAKVEKPQAVERLDHILGRVDAVMVARGDLGVEMPLETVPVAQKRIIQAARCAAKPVITATQMLRSMVDNPRPTRAEASDVANAVVDGTDAVMLSEESAVGRYPTQAVRMLDRIARATEENQDGYHHLGDAIGERLPTVAVSIARSASMLAADVGATAIVATTKSGSTARMLSRFRPCVPVVGLTTEPEVRRQLALSWGVIPGQARAFDSTDDLFDLSRDWCLRHGLARAGDRIVVTAGLPIDVTGTTNLVHVVEI